MPTLTADLLNTYLGKSIGEICDMGYASASDNHCAHFVSHVMGIKGPANCRLMADNRKANKDAGVMVRVHELFERCPERYELIMTQLDQQGLIFVSDKSNFRLVGRTSVLDNVPKKHVGVLFNGTVWHYSNSKSKVVKMGMAEFSHHYPKQQNALWFGSFPPGADAREFALASMPAGR